MIKLLPNLPDHVVGIIASGQVTAADYESVVMPAVESVLKKHAKIRLLYQIGPDVTTITPGAMWDDMKVGFGHLRAWERVALVTDVGWIAHATNLSRFLMPCPVKVFAVKDRDEAEGWIVG